MCGQSRFFDPLSPNYYSQCTCNHAGEETGFATVYEIVPGFIICTLVIVLVSLIDKKPSRELQERFEKADAEYRASK